jgi:hypothetical protein
LGPTLGSAAKPVVTVVRSRAIGFIVSGVSWKNQRAWKDERDGFEARGGQDEIAPSPAYSGTLTPSLGSRLARVAAEKEAKSARTSDRMQADVTASVFVFI